MPPPAAPTVHRLDQSTEAALVSGTVAGARVSLYRNGVWAAWVDAASTSTRIPLAHGLTPGEVITATQSVGGLSSAPSSPVTVELNHVMHHFDRSRTGWNPYETTLNTSNVNPTTFGCLFAQPVDGQVYAQPLYVQNLAVSGIGVRNVLYVATENDSVYAFDADNNVPPLLERSLVPAGERVVQSADVGGCNNIDPVIGITGTPVIDRTTNTLFVVAKTTDGIQFHSRLYALDLGSLADQQPPVDMQASAPGTGAGTVGGVIHFDPKWHNNRPALLLSNGVIYVAFASHCDLAPYHGWLLAYDAASLSLVAASNTSPDTAPVTGGGGFRDQAAGVWMSGCGPAADSDGYIYLETGNGPFTASTGGRDYGDSVLKLLPDLSVSSYFTPSNQQYLNDNDLDLGSGGIMVLPVQPPPYTDLLVGCGKDGRIFLMNRGSLGGYQPGDSGLLQNPTQTVEGIWGGPAYFHGPTGQFVYYCGNGGNLHAFALVGAALTPSSRSAETFSGPAEGGAIPTVSSNASNIGSGVLWLVGRTDPLNLFAYDATNVSVKLFQGVAGPWNNTNGGAYMVPTAVNGKVYVGTATQVAFFGLVPKHKPEKWEKLEKWEKFEKLEFKEKEIKPEVEGKLLLPKELKEKEILEGPWSWGPGDPFVQRLQAVENAVEQLSHFIRTELRPNLSRGALSNEPDQSAGQAPAIRRRRRRAGARGPEAG